MEPAAFYFNLLLFPICCFAKQIAHLYVQSRISGMESISMFAHACSGVEECDATLLNIDQKDDSIIILTFPSLHFPFPTYLFLSLPKIQFCPE